jgi:hypothetical protein
MPVVIEDPKIVGLPKVAQNYLVMLPVLLLYGLLVYFVGDEFPDPLGPQFLDQAFMVQSVVGRQQKNRSRSGKKNPSLHKAPPFFLKRLLSKRFGGPQDNRQIGGPLTIGRKSMQRRALETKHLLFSRFAIPKQTPSKSFAQTDFLERMLVRLRRQDYP